MNFGTRNAIANLTHEYLQALPKGLFNLTAEFQELVMPKQMTDSTSAGVLIQSPSPNSRTSLRARECLPCTSKFRPSHRSCIHSVTGTPAQLFCQMLSTHHCKPRVLENHPGHQRLHSHAARAETALGTKGLHPIAFPSTNYPPWSVSTILYLVPSQTTCDTVASSLEYHAKESRPSLAFPLTSTLSPWPLPELQFQPQLLFIYIKLFLFYLKSTFYLLQAVL